MRAAGRLSGVGGARHPRRARDRGPRTHPRVPCGASGLIGNATKPEELAALKKRIVHAKDVAREFGFDEVCFYGFDEAVGDRLVSQIPAWKAVREADGVVETLALTGLSSAIKDVRYMALFRKLLKAHPNAAAQQWFDGLKPYEDDPARVRRETIDWILSVTCNLR